jgi:hypothetical protein
MTDAATISAGLQSLKAAFDISKALLNLGLSAQIKDQIREMNDRILAAQESAIASRDYQSALLKQINDLEKQIADLEKWDAEAETYQLTDIGRPVPTPFVHRVVYAYCPKQGTHTTEPPHSLCANCFNDRHKSILQPQQLVGHIDTLFCQRCHEVLYLAGERPAQGAKPAPPRTFV